MTEEQKKVRKFYKDFQGWKVDTVGTWIGAGFLVVLMLIVCAIPVQEILSEVAEEMEAVSWMMLLLFGPLAGFLYLRPYTSVTEIVYTNRAKNVRIIDKLKYLPIDLKEIRKMKVTYLLKFFAKLFPFALGLQFLTSIGSYGKITWMNVVYVLVVAFLWPVAVNLPAILAERDLDLSVSQKFAKHWKLIVVVVLLVLGATYMFFPRNVKDLFLKGADEKNITLTVHDVSGEAYAEYDLSQEQKEEMLALWARSYVRMNLFPVKSISEHYMGYYIYISGNQDMICFFSEDIISINERQYKIYGDTLAEEFRAIVEVE